MRLSKKKKKKFNAPQLKKARGVRVLCFLTLAFSLTVGSFLIERITFSAGGSISPNKSTPQPIKTPVAAVPKPTLPADTPTLTQIPTATTEVSSPAQIPPQKSASRYKVVINETLDIPFEAELNSIVVVSPEIAAAQIKNGHSLTIKGLKIGETILIVSTTQKRLTFIVQVTGTPAISERAKTVDAERAAGENARTSGSYSVNYVKGFDGSPSLLRNNVEFRRKLSKDRTLRVSGEMFKLFGGADRTQAIAGVRNFGLNRLSVGIDSPDKTIDFLDSQVNISPLSLNGFTMRGVHLTTKPKAAAKSSANENLQKKGVEIFAGLARPSLALFDDDGGKIIGAMLPVASGESWQARAGFISVVPQKNSRFRHGGTLLQANVSFAPNKKFSAFGEAAYANGGFSRGARLDLKLKRFGASGEIVRFDEKSPLNGIGAQSGGRKSEALSFYWRPDNRFSASVSFNHTEVTRLANSRLANFERSTFLANFNYKINRTSRLNFRFIDQKAEIAVPGGSSNFQIETRGLAAGYNVRFNKNWTNNFEARLNFSRETSAVAELEKGFNLNEQLHFSWKQNSVTGFINYANNTPSLASLIVRNPQLLPPPLQAAFVLDPALFLQTYRDRISFLLPGIELPQTRNLDAGILFQKTFSRFTLLGEARYNTGEILSQNQNNFSASLGLNVRLDAANSVQINGWRSFGTAGNQTSVIFGFTHRFGKESGGGFQFSKLLRLNKGKVSGRVYDDLNGNGQDDAGEPGIVGQTIQLNEKRSVKTDADGRYQFSASEGAYNIRLVSEDLGVRLRASTATERQISLSSGQTVNVSFGVSTFGFLGGRVFNDSGLTDEMSKYKSQGVDGVRLVLRSLDVQSKNFVVEKISSGGGNYEFRNLRPGNYLLAVDLATLPANFRVPAKTSWGIKVAPLAGFYLDIPIAAQRAVAGVVFVDKDGDGNYNPQIDEAVAGASIFAGDASAISDQSGAYIVRNLSAGKIKIIVRAPFETKNSTIYLELGSEPTTKRAFNLAVRR